MRLLFSNDNTKKKQNPSKEHVQNHRQLHVVCVCVLVLTILQKKKKMPPKHRRWVALILCVSCQPSTSTSNQLIRIKSH